MHCLQELAEAQHALQQVQSAQCEAEAQHEDTAAALSSMDQQAAQLQAQLGATSAERDQALSCLSEMQASVRTYMLQL